MRLRVSGRDLRDLSSVLIIVALALSMLAAPARAASSGSLAPPYTDMGVDTDADGAYNHLVVSAHITVTSPGVFTILVILWDGSLTTAITSVAIVPYIDSSTDYYLGFQGTDIYKSGLNGPYVVNWTLFDDSGAFLSYASHTTAAYSYTDFDAPPISFAQPPADSGRDTNGNGRFDFLDLNLTMNTLVAGEYTVQASIHDTAYTYHDLAVVDRWFNVGQTALTVSFLGMRINATGVDGPFDVSLSTYDSATFVLYDQLESTTHAYLASEFDAPPARLQPPYHDSLNDSNGDGLADWLFIDVPVNVSVAGDYYLRGLAMHNPSGTFMGFDYTKASLTPGLHTLRLQYSTMAAGLAGVDGPYTVDLDFYETHEPESPATLIMEGRVTTSAYASSGFAPPTATIGAPITDQGSDRSSPPDGSYDVLEVTVPIDVAQAGTYEIWASMWGPWLYEDRSEYFTPGAHSITLEFSGTEIANYGMDGPYQVDIDLSQILGGRFLEIQTLYGQVTGAYSVGDFQAAAPALLRGTVNDAASGLPVKAATIEAYNFTTRDLVRVSTNAAGNYTAPLFEGDWVVTVDAPAYQAQIQHLSVGPAGQRLDASLGPVVPQAAAINLTFSDWNSALRERSWLFTTDNATTRLYYDWYYGNRDGYLALPEFMAAEGNASGLPVPVPGVSDSLFQVDGQSFDLVPGSDSYTWGSVEGSIDDPAPMTGVELGSFDGGVAPAPSHELAVNVSYDLWYNDRTYRVVLPPGEVALAVSSAPSVSVTGLLTGTVTLNPGLHPDPWDGNDSVWVTILAGAPDTSPPAIDSVVASPDPAELGASVAIDAVVTDDTGVNSTTVAVQDPQGNLVGNFTMALVGADTFEATVPADVVGTYSFTLWARDVAGNTATASGSFSVADTAGPVISGLWVDPDPIELGATGLLSVRTADLSGVDAVSAEIAGPATDLGSFPMSYDAASGNWTLDLVLAASGPYRANVTASDAFGNTANLSKAFEVRDTTLPTIASASATPDPQEIGGTVTFSAQASDLGGIQAVTVEIHGPGGGLLGNVTMTYSSSSGLWTASQTFDGRGTYSFTVWASDASGNVASSSGSFRMRDTTAPALTGAAASPSPVEIHGTVSFSVTATDLDGVVSVKIEIRDPQDQAVGNFTMAVGSGDAYGYSFAPSDLGTYSYRISAFDASGNGRMVSGSFVVQDTTAPTAVAGSDQTVVQGTIVTFNGTASTDNAAVSTYTWTFNDGGAKTLTGVSPTYTFVNVGTFTVTLTVADASGNTATDTMTVTVTALPPTTGSISGTVSDANGAAIQGATVDLMSGSTKAATATTDAQGHFSFTNVNAGTYTLQVQATGYDPGSAQVAVVAGQTATSTVHLTVTATTPPQGGVDWLPILVIVAVVAAAAAGAFLYLRRRKA